MSMRTLNQKTGGFLAICLFVISGWGGSAFGQEPDPYPVINRDHFTLYPEIASDSRTELRTCEQSERGLRAAIIKAYFNHKAVENYVATGLFEVEGSDIGWIKLEEDKDHVEEIKTYLAGVDSTGKSAVLVYDYEISPGSLSFCSWMITPDQLIMPLEKFEMSSDRPLSIRQREALAVTAFSYSDLRELAQSCRPENNLNNSTPGVFECLQRVAEERDDAVTPSMTAVEDMAEISAALVPAPYHAGLLDGSINRLIVLPAVDIGNVSFSSLQISDGTHLVDHASVIVTNDFFNLIGVEQEEPRSTFPDTGALVVVNPTGDLASAQKEGELNIKVLSKNSVGVTGLINQAANKANVIAALAGKSMFFYAGHGQSSPAHWGDNSLVLTRKVLFTDEEILNLVKENGPFLNRALVVLSSCQSGLGAVMGGTVLGLPTAFSAAGAEQTVMSLWDVNDDATFELMSVFSVGYFKHASRNAEDALRDAINKFRQDDVLASAPALWAGFSVYGTPAKR